MPSQPITADLQAAIKKTLHSASFAKFMASTVQSAMAEAQPQPRSIVLPAAEEMRRGYFGWHGSYATYEKHNVARTHSFSLQCQPYSGELDMLGKWYGNETRVDQAGRAWVRQIGYSVVDDFGNLVEVAP